MLVGRELTHLEVASFESHAHAKLARLVASRTPWSRYLVHIPTEAWNVCLYVPYYPI